MLSPPCAEFPRALNPPPPPLLAPHQALSAPKRQVIKKRKERLRYKGKGKPDEKVQSQFHRRSPSTSGMSRLGAEPNNLAERSMQRRAGELGIDVEPVLQRPGSARSAGGALDSSRVRPFVQREVRTDYLSKPPRMPPFSFLSPTPRPLLLLSAPCLNGGNVRVDPKLLLQLPVIRDEPSGRPLPRSTSFGSTADAVAASPALLPPPPPEEPTSLPPSLVPDPAESMEVTPEMLQVANQTDESSEVRTPPPPPSDALLLPFCSLALCLGLALAFSPPQAAFFCSLAVLPWTPSPALLCCSPSLEAFFCPAPGTRQRPRLLPQPPPSLVALSRERPFPVTVWQQPGRGAERGRGS